MTDRAASALSEEPKGATNSTLELLLASAAELFRKKGYAGTTTRELSALIGLQSASLYYHMSSKEDLLFKLCAATLEDVTAVFDSVFETARTNDENPLATMHNLVVGYVELILRDHDRHATMLIEIRSLSEGHRKTIVKQRDKNVRMVQELFERAQASNQIRSDIDAHYLTLALFNLLNWSIFWYSAEGELRPQEIGEMLWSVFATGSVKQGA
ncbi:MAG TPA: TetR/AcrR family transcriptional regulator [Acidimicrobiales bacterium]